MISSLPSMRSVLAGCLVAAAGCGSVAFAQVAPANGPLGASPADFERFVRSSAAAIGAIDPVLAACGFSSRDRHRAERVVAYTRKQILDVAPSSQYAQAFDESARHSTAATRAHFAALASSEKTNACKQAKATVPAQLAAAEAQIPAGFMQDKVGIPKPIPAAPLQLPK